MSSNHQLVPFIPPSVVFGPDKLITAWRIVWRLQILQGNLNKNYKEIWTNTIRQSEQQGWRWQGRLMDLATEGISHGLTLDRNARPLVVHLCPAYSHLPPVPPSCPLYQYLSHPIVMLYPIMLYHWKHTPLLPPCTPKSVSNPTHSNVVPNNTLIIENILSSHPPPRVPPFCLLHQVSSPS